MVGQAASAAGVAFVAPGGLALFVKRGPKGDHAGEWCFPGGMAEGDETPEQAAARETQEETGRSPGGTMRGVHQGSHGVDGGLIFTTFREDVSEHFVPMLNDESVGYAWAPVEDPPQPLHPSVLDVLPKLKSAKAQAADAALAFDRDSVRTYDRDGRLHVAATNISKAAVNPYRGREIPAWETLGLDPDKIYNLFRHPEEIAKGASTFNNVPLLSRHVAVTADDHQPELVIGSTGTDAEFDAPYLRNSLVIWAKGGIEDVEADEKKELSCAYRYRADMTPGTFEGVPYDGVMRDIVANHVALVKEGRAGADVVVGDSTEILMSKPVLLTRKAAAAHGALLVYLKPKLAQDAKIDLTPSLTGITPKNYKAKKPELATAVRAATKGKLAKDANLEDVEKVLDMLDEHDINEIGTKDAAETDPNTGLPIEIKTDPTDGANADLRAFLASKGLSEEDISTACGMAGTNAMGADETDEEKKAREAKEKDRDTRNSGAKDADVPPFKKKDDDDKDDKDMVKKPAMDAAIRLAVKAATDAATKTQREIRDAERAVRPYVGDLAIAHDSAEGVFRTALTSLGVKVDGVHPSAFPVLLEMQPKPSARKPERIAMDAASKASFDTMFPDAARISLRG